MNRYTHAITLLESAYYTTERLSLYIKRLNEAKEIRQHLASSYGTERVSSSPSNDNPAQIALERYDELIHNMSCEIARCTKLITDAQNYISLISSPESRDILSLHYLSGWSFSKIARMKLKKCSVRTIIRKRDSALCELRIKLSQK